VQDRTCRPTVHLTVPHVSIRKSDALWIKTISTLFGFPLHVTGYMKLTHLRAVNTPGTDIKTIKYTLFQSSKRMIEGVESIKLARSRLMSRGCKTE